ncbi:MAG: hypothetical protein ACTHNA_00840 [Sphingopyxis terrae]|uniref:hypothetical protein n=1 Tax=Sphingopyxis terrae TaxID=33052 RepID=UPI003F7EADF8
MYRSVIWSVAVGFAIVIGLASFSVANQLRRPVAALLLGFPAAANAGGELAARTFGVRQRLNPESAVTANERRLALRAYRAEPLSPASLSILIAARDGDVAERQELLDLASRLSRRNSYVGTQQINAAAERGDNGVFFLWLSRLTLTNSDLRPTLINAMADATSRDGAVAALEPVLESDPRWADAYWEAVVQRRQSLVNAALLRMRIARKHSTQREISQSDKSLSGGLARIGAFETARRLYAALTGSDMASASGDVLQNSNFSRIPLLPPFDWQLAMTGTLGASIDTTARNLTISAIGGSRGYAARQLVQLMPGRYRVAWEETSISPNPSGGLSVRISCADTGKRSMAINPIEVARPKDVQPVIIPDGACKWYWFALHVDLPDDSPGIDTSFSRLSISREEKVAVGKGSKTNAG